ASPIVRTITLADLRRSFLGLLDARRANVAEQGLSEVSTRRAFRYPKGPQGRNARRVETSESPLRAAVPGLTLPRRAGPREAPPPTPDSPFPTSARVATRARTPPAARASPGAPGRRTAPRAARAPPACPRPSRRCAGTTCAPRRGRATRRAARARG